MERSDTSKLSSDLYTHAVAHVYTQTYSPMGLEGGHSGYRKKGLFQSTWVQRPARSFWFTTVYNSVAGNLMPSLASTGTRGVCSTDMQVKHACI